jgi:Zn-dependent protease
MFGEPPPTQGDLRFVIFGVPVRVHPFFWLIAALLGMNSGSPADLITWIAAVFISILCHELGHALTMRAYGFYPWITLYGMGGLTSYDQGRACGSRGAGPLGQVLITLAGPAAGFLLAGVLIGVFFASGRIQDLLMSGKPISRLAFDIVEIGIVWGIMNLLPVYPLDGGQVAREVLLVVNPRDGIRNSLMLSIFTGVVVAVIALTRLNQPYVAALFGYLAYASYRMLEAFTYRR